MPEGAPSPAAPPWPERRLAQIRGLVAAGGPAVVLRPILDLRDLDLLAVQAQPQFPDGADPARWFADAGGLGVTLELELAAMAAALAAVDRVLSSLPEDVGLWVAASPATVCAPQLRQLLAASAVPVTVSMGEHDVLADHPGLLTARSELRRAGIRLAVEGVTAGYPGLRTLLHLHPDVVRLDRSLAHGIHGDLARAELTRAVIRVTEHLGAFLVASGIEERADAEALLALGIRAGEGPGLPDAVPPAPAGAPPARAGAAAGAMRAVGAGGPWTLEELVRPVLELVVRLTGLETAYLTVLDPDQGWLEHRFVCNTGTLEVPEGLTIPWIDSLCKRCRDAGLVWTPDVPGDLPPIPLGRDAPIQTFVSVPVVLADGHTAGTLCAMGSAVRHLDSDMLAELAFFARLLAERYPDELGGGPAGTPLVTHSHRLASGDPGAPA